MIEFARATSPLGLLLHGQAGEREIPYCYRCPLGHAYPGCGVACADDLERTILMEGPDSIAAFIAEPVIGSTVTGVVPVPEYYRRIREICDAYDVLFIADEVLTGYGRTGRWLAIEHWGVEPDIVVMGKGISGGYVPLGAVLAAPRVVDAFTAGSGTFSHGFTSSGNPLCTFVGLQGAALRAGARAVRRGGGQGAAAARGARPARRPARDHRRRPRAWAVRRSGVRGRPGQPGAVR